VGHLSQEQSTVSTTKLPCGCKHDGARWTVQCAEHRRENDRLHIQASRDRGTKPRPSAQAQAQLDAEDAAEYDAETEALNFENAALTQPGESVISTVDRAFKPKPA
jgi:hypothetical protein